MSIALFTAMLLAPLPQSLASDPFTSPPPPISGRAGVGGDVEDHFFQLHRDLVSAQAGGEISADAARDLNVRVERIRRQMVRMGNVVGHRQRLRLRAKIDAVRSQLAESRARGTGKG
ncbi:MAG TPA: hypothetical protein VEA61_09165 [Allosphingosinicella sp.]|nr:hypothetical protein [Allosphingosinicella sp.]